MAHGVLGLASLGYQEAELIHKGEVGALVVAKIKIKLIIYEQKLLKTETRPLWFLGLAFWKSVTGI